LVTRPIVVGIAGGSGSGKTTFGRLLAARLGPERSAILSQDAYYRDLHEYFDGDGGSVNFDHPESLEFELLADHLDRLKTGHTVRVPRYDFATHRRLAETVDFAPRPVLIVDGILLLSQESVRARLDVAIFIETAEPVRFTRRLARDVAERGRTADGVRQQFARQVKPMHDLFVAPSKRFADRVISGETDFGPALDALVIELTASS
jgi:uridine kinase